MEQDTTTIDVLECHNMDWFTNNRTYVTRPYSADGRQYPAVWSLEPSEECLTLTWNETTGQVEVDMSDIFKGAATQYDVNLFASQAEVAEAAISVHQSVAQREHNHPLKFGLVAKMLPSANQGQPAPVPGYAKKSYSRATVRLDSVPERERLIGLAWFAPTGNQERFGTLFVYAQESMDTVDDKLVLNVRWTLGQVGRPDTELESVAWNDRAGMTRMCEQVLQGDSDYFMAIAALSEDAEKLRTQRNNQERREAMITAREAFGRTQDRVKPRLIETAIRNAMHEIGTEWNGTLRDHEYYSNTDKMALNSVQAFGYHNNKRPINGAYRVSFYQRPSSYSYQTSKNVEPLPVEHFDEYAKLLSEKVNARKLGSILRVEDGKSVSFYVVANVGLVLKHGPAFNIFDHMTVHQYKPDSGNGAQWVARSLPANAID